jgi:transcriptional regulator with XRE-family HTH domain
MAKTLKPTSDAMEILHRRAFEGKPARLKNLDEARANAEIARKIRELRETAALTQTQLAKLIGTTASVICRLEDADYEGHSLAMLRRIAGALNQRVEIRFTDSAVGIAHGMDDNGQRLTELSNCVRTRAGVMPNRDGRQGMCCKPHLHRVEPALLRISCSDAEEDVDEFTLSDRVAFRNPPDSSLPNHMHGLITFDGSPGCLY